MGSRRLGRDEEIVERLRDVNRELRERIGRQGEAEGFPRFSRRLPMMREVLREPGITVNELARRTRMAKSQVSMLVAALVSDGLIRREEDPDDQRLVRLFPTNDGTARAARWRTVYRGMLSSTVRSLSNDEADHLLDGLRALQRLLSGDEEEKEAAR